MGLKDLVDDDESEDEEPEFDSSRDLLTSSGASAGDSELDEEWRHDYSGDSIDKEQAVTIKKIRTNMRNRAMETGLDVQIEDGRIEGDVRDLALLFSFMTMDVGKAEINDLVE